jgi:hypothetical protein
VGEWKMVISMIDDLHGSIEKSGSKFWLTD